MAFWVDLTTAKLIPETFNHYYPGFWGDNPGITSTNMGLYLPPAKIGNGNYVYVWSGGVGNGGDGKNYFGISVSTSIDTSGFMPSTVGLSVQQAYNMDKKVDDGLAQSGNVTAMYIAGINFYGGDWVGVAPGVAAGGTSATCYDNAGNTSNPMLYSVTQNNGTGMNCALSFKLQ